MTELPAAKAGAIFLTAEKKRCQLENPGDHSRRLLTNKERVVKRRDLDDNAQWGPFYIVEDLTLTKRH